MNQEETLREKIEEENTKRPLEQSPNKQKEFLDSEKTSKNMMNQTHHYKITIIN